jgi:hypothetical protein
MWELAWNWQRKEQIKVSSWWVKMLCQNSWRHMAPSMEMPITPPTKGLQDIGSSPVTPMVIVSL